MFRKRGLNPLSEEEKRRLGEYWRRLENGEVLTEEEAMEFYRISKKLRDERKSDTAAWVLVG